MKKCSQFDENKGRCKSGWVRTFPLCRGMFDQKDDERAVPYCMREDPPPQFLREGGLPIGWPLNERTGGE